MPTGSTAQPRRRHSNLQIGLLPLLPVSYPYEHFRSPRPGAIYQAGIFNTTDERPSDANATMASMGQFQTGQVSVGQHRRADRSFQLRPLLPSASKWRMQRLSSEASCVSNPFCQFACPRLLRRKRSGIYRRLPGEAHVRCDSDKSVFKGSKGSYRKHRLGFLPVNDASSAFAGD